MQGEGREYPIINNLTSAASVCIRAGDETQKPHKPSSTWGEPKWNARCFDLIKGWTQSSKPCRTVQSIPTVSRLETVGPNGDSWDY